MCVWCDEVRERGVKGSDCVRGGVCVVVRWDEGGAVCGAVYVW